MPICAVNCYKGRVKHMASGKVKRTSAKKSKANLVLGLVIALIVICIAGFFVYASGLLQRTLTGVKVIETAADGTSTTVKNYSVQEANYHFNEIFSMYSMYGMVDRAKLDEKVSEQSEETWRETLYKAAADEMMENALVLRAYENDANKPEFGADRYAEMQLEVMKDQATKYKYDSLNQYMQAMYGTGFNAFDFKKITKNEIIAREYENYKKQFVCVPGDADIQTAFDNDPTAYQKADFNYYFFAAKMDDQGKMTNLDQTKTDAKEVMDAVNGGKTFKEAVKTVLEKDKTANESALASFTDDNVDPTFITGYSKDTAEYVYSKAEGVINAIFGKDAVMGKTVTIEAENGTYVVCPVAMKLDETATVTYRTLTIDNPDYKGVDTQADVLASGLAKARSQAEQIIASPMDPAAFAAAVRKNSTDTNEIVSAGYVSGDTPSKYEPAADQEAEQSAEDKALGEWLFAADRKAGDTMILNSADSSKVTIYYFESSMPAWRASVRNSIADTLLESWKSELKAGNPSTVINVGLNKFLLY